jgi:hypothetical protein
LKRLASILLLLFSIPAIAQSDFSFNGYVKLLGTFNNINPNFLPEDDIPEPVKPLFPYSSQDYQIHNRFNAKWYGPAGLSVGVGMRNRLFWGYTVRSYDDYRPLYNFLGFESFDELVDFSSYFDLSIIWWQNRNTVLHTVFDRLYLEWEQEKFRIRLGRQRINWGVNNAFNPNDLFNQYNFFDFDYEERPGVDAALVQYYINPYSSVEAAFTPGRDSIQQSVGAVLFRLNKWGYDWQLLAGYYLDDFAFGGGWAGNIRGAGWKGEATYFQPLNNYSQSSLVVSLALDYSLRNGIYLMGGYIFNERGTTSSEFTDLVGLSTAQLSAKNLFPYKHTLLFTTGYNLTALLRFDFSWGQTPDFSNAFAVPSFTYSIIKNLDFLVLGQLFFANKPDTDQFGFFSSSIFTRLKYSF